MHLYSDKSASCHIVLAVDRRDSIDPRANAISDGFDAEVVPLVLFEGIAGSLIGSEIVEPSAVAAFVEPAGPGAV